jgi:fatty acid desaturase
MNTVFMKPTLIVPDKLSSNEMRELGVLDSWRFCLALGFDLAVIAAAIGLSEWFYFNPFVYLASVVLIGARMHALAILVHDCVHYRAFNHRALNMIVAEPIAWSLLTTAAGYRANHLTHHRHLNTLEDPDWVRKIGQGKFQFPKSRSAVAKDLLFQLSGLGFVELALNLSKTSAENPLQPGVRWLRLAFYACVIGLCIATGTLGKLALYWLVPLLTGFSLVFYVRSAAEHHGNLPYDHLYTNSRTTIPRAWESFLILPHNVGYHLEHHLYPHVPFYRLPTLHRRLMQRPHFAERAHLTKGVCAGLLKEWVAAPRGPHVRDIQHQQEAAQASPAV